MKTLKRFLTKLKIMNQSGWRLGQKKEWKGGHTKKVSEMDNFGKRLGLKKLNL